MRVTSTFYGVRHGRATVESTGLEAAPRRGAHGRPGASHSSRASFRHRLAPPSKAAGAGAPRVTGGRPDGPDADHR
jgi:hypothetical protein